MSTLEDIIDSVTKKCLRDDECTTDLYPLLNYKLYTTIYTKLECSEVGNSHGNGY